MRKMLVAITAAAMLPLGACANGGLFDQSPYEARQEARQERREDRRDAAERYRDDARYQERVLARNERIYRGSNGQYYCERPDGTTGLIVGALGGGVLGNIIAPGGSGFIGSLIGAGAGAVLGRAIERGEARCR